MNALHRWTLAAALLASPAVVHAQEVRCPQGYESLPTPGGGGDQHVLAACVQGPVQIVISSTSASITPSSPEEAEVVQSLASRIAQGGSMTASPVRTENLAGRASRVADFSGQVTLPDGTDARVEGMVAMIPAQGGTVVLMALSRDPNAAHVAPAVRAIVPTIVGLGNTPPAWRASAACPAGMEGSAAGGTAANGMRRVARCQTESGTQLEVLESMLPLRNEADARGPAVTVHRSLGGQLQQLGGSAQLDATQSVEVRPGLRGFVTSIHGSASDPRAPQGAGGGQIHVEAQVVMLPTTAGHVEIVAISQQGDANALATLVRNFVINNLRLDGSGVPVTAVTAAEDGGTPAATTPTEPTPPTPRRREIDLSRPLWDPGAEERPRATTPAPQSKSCGCRTVGETSRTSSSLTFTALLGSAIALAFRTRRKRRSVH